MGRRCANRRLQSRTMRPYLFTALSAVSLLLCIGFGALWMRGYWIADLFAYNNQPPTTYYLIGSDWRGIQVHRLRFPQPHAIWWDDGQFHYERRGAGEDETFSPSKWRCLGFQVWANPTGVCINFPFWFLVAASLILPAVWIRSTYIIG